MFTSPFVESLPLSVAQSISLLLPITFGGILFIICMRKGWFVWLDVAIDGGLLLRGKPLVGRSKTWRSLVIYFVVAATVSFLLQQGATHTDLIARVYLNNPLVLAAQTTSAYVGGEVLNSFVKRRLGITSSGQAKSRLGSKVQAFFDNVDGIIASGLVLILVYGVPGEILVLSFVFSYLTHLSTDALMRRLRLKRKQQQG